MFCQYDIVLLMPKINQKGAVHLVLLVLIIAGIATATFLVQQETNFLPKANSDEEVSPEPEEEPEAEPGDGGSPVSTTEETAISAEEAETSVHSTYDAYEAALADLGKAELGEGDMTVEDATLAVEAARGAYEVAAGVFEGVFGGEASRAENISGIAQEIQNGNVSWQDAIQGKEDLIGIDGIAVAIGSDPNLTTEGRTQALESYLSEHNLNAANGAGMGAIMEMTAGGNAFSVMSASARGELAATGEKSVGGAIATGEFLGLSPEEMTQNAVSIARDVLNMTQEEFAASVIGSQLTAEQIGALWSGAPNLASLVSDAREVNTQQTLGPVTAVPVGTLPVEVELSNPNSISANSTLTEQLGAVSGNYKTNVAPHTVTDQEGGKHMEGGFLMTQTDMDGRSISYSIPLGGNSVTVSYADSNPGGRQSAIEISNVTAPSGGFNNIGALETFVNDNKDKVSKI